MRVFKKMLTVAAMATVLKLVGAASIDPQELEDIKEGLHILDKILKAITALGDDLEIVADNDNDNTMIEEIEKVLGAERFKNAEDAIKNMRSDISVLRGVMDFMEEFIKAEKIVEALGAENLEEIGQVFDEFIKEMDELQGEQECNFAVAQTAPSVAATVLMTTTAVWAFA